MAWIFGNQRANNPDPVAVGLRVQSSLQGVSIPIGCGRSRWSSNLINWAGFVATPVQSSGGKGGAIGGATGKGSTGQYNYSVWGIVSLGEGGMLSLNRIFNGSYIDFLVPPTAQELTDLYDMGVNTDDLTSGNTYNTIFHTGNWTDGPDSTWSARFPSQTAVAYPGQAYVIFPNIGLGSSPAFPSFSFDATWSLSSDIPALGADANPADWIEAFLANADWGVQGFPSGAIGDFATARNYWRANGLLISLTLTSPTAGQSHLKDLMGSLNCDFRWSSGKLDIVPYGDVAVTGNGYTYTPNLTPEYNLTVDDFLPNQGSLGNAATADKVKVATSRADASQIPNIFQVEYADRANLYNPVTIYQSNDAQIAASGRKRFSDKATQHWFCLAAAASLSCTLQLHRAWLTLNSYQWTLGKQFILLDVMDIVSITEPALQLDQQLVRITEIQENEDGTLTMTAEEVSLTSSAPVYARQPSISAANLTNAQPGNVNAPFFFEPPDALSDGLILMIGLSGVNPATYGGCQVWVSSDGENYDLLGNAEGASRIGVLTAPLASVSPAVVGQTIDATNTLALDLTESAGALTSVTATSFAALSTISVVDNEVIAYENAALVSAYGYDLTTLARGAYGSTIAAHATGAPFLRIDGTTFQWNFASSYVGQKVYFKFLAFNTFGNATQNLADVGAYAYTVQGSALSSPLPSVTGVYTNYEAGFQKIYWDEVSDFRSGILYEIRQGSTWTGAIPVTTQAHPPFIARGDATFWIAARCTPVTGLTVYSAEPQSITIAGNWIPANSFWSFDEQATGWPGVKDNGMGIQGTGTTAYLRLGGATNILTEANVLTDPDILDSGGIITGDALYYTSPNIVDVGYTAEMQVNATTEITGSPYSQDILTVGDFLNYPDVLGSSSAALITGWVEIRTAPSGASPVWGSWQKFVPGVFPGQYVQLRLALESFDPASVPLALAFSWSVSAPDRVDHYQGLTVPSGGLTIVFQPDGAGGPGAFNSGPNGAALPYVSVSWQATAGDTYVITGESLSQLTITFINSGVSVTRTGVNVDAAGF